MGVSSVSRKGDVPIQVQTHQVPEEGFEGMHVGVIRVSGHVVHTSTLAYDNPDRASSMAVLEFVSGLRAVMNGIEFTHNEDGSLESYSW